ncbi:MAG: hypothetical protein CGU29_16130 [Candidatus Dactylopiibacterium carminicum]|uniref:Uncharacterized protein n=1 Tax=Candidatus Dactylopiibacterium carminicum TaxID=857335 RepID=A0A272EN27_9RHOO|nr:hypothetical protein [Candidatus Dactylopiibacterium carminicum]KAF7597919.1 hypothetical protein BGI27_16110 [Candidatus Dactylopiibacterium carminicum]PAS91492.1 MAG: hypothetical protein CGU29_16130 [Candidatus Dactylopiibacterium carminicum]PAS95984.1 MAG: hypothetical protein BSR46_16145 [Candidatus Dactylopiibacterium carminicum]
MRFRFLCAGVALCCLSGIGAQAASSSSTSGNPPTPPNGQRPPGPPPEAIAACKGKTEGVEVSFSGPKGETFTGICRTQDGQLAAMPKDMPSGDRKGPPPSR